MSRMAGYFNTELETIQSGFTYALPCPARRTSLHCLPQARWCRNHLCACEVRDLGGRQLHILDLGVPAVATAMVKRLLGQKKGR